MIYSDGRDLRYDVMHGLRHLYTIKMMSLRGNEIKLNDGRFSSFTLVAQDNKIEVNFNGCGQDELSFRFAEIVEWIATNVSDEWSFNPITESVGKMNIEFTFKSAEHAVIFKLFCGDCPCGTARWV